MDRKYEFVALVVLYRFSGFFSGLEVVLVVTEVTIGRSVKEKVIEVLP